MFERVFNRLGHGSVVEKNRGRRRGEEEEEMKKKKNQRKVAGFFCLFVFFGFKIRNREISWEGWGTLGKWGR